MKTKTSVIIIFLFISSCISNKEKEIVNPAKQTLDNFIHDLETIETNPVFLLNKYFYNYKEIENDSIYNTFHIAIMESFVAALYNDTLKKRFYWNEDADNYKKYEIGDSNGQCHDRLLVVFEGDTTYKKVRDFQFCFNEEGDIFSFISLNKPENDSTVWLRNQQEYVHIEEGQIAIGF